MLDIEVVIKSLEVTEYTKELLQLTVIFVDDKEKAIKHDVDIQNSEEAERIIKKIRDYETRENAQVPDEGDVLSGMINVKIKDEDEVTKKMNQFLYKITNNLKNITSSRAAINYLQTVSNIKNQRLDLTY